PAATQHAATLEQRAGGYGIDFVAVDGNDVAATASAMTAVVDAVRAGGGPVIVEATTYRWHGHYEGDPERYRSTQEVQQWAARDPLVVSAAHLRSRGVGAHVIDAMRDDVALQLDAAVEAARRATTPPVSSLGDFVVRAREELPEPPTPPDDAPVFRTMDAIHDALEHELAADDRVFVAGIDVAAGG